MPTPTTIADATAATAQAAVAASAGHDPILVGLAWIVGIVTLLLAIGKPIRDYLRSEKKADTESKVDDAKAGAETVLYNHLSDQVKQYRDIADKAFTERNALVERVAALEARACDLVRAEKSIDSMRARLEEKDAQIKELLAQAAEERKQFLTILQAKDAEITRRDERITTLETRQRELENRLCYDEFSLGMSCPYAALQRTLPGITPTSEVAA